MPPDTTPSFPHHRLDAYQVALELAVAFGLLAPSEVEMALDRAGRLGAMLTGLILRFR